MIEPVVFHLDSFVLANSLVDGSVPDGGDENAWYRLLPHVNALLNTVAATLLVRGYVLIRAGNQRAHARTMVAAFVVSALFLISYLTYHSLAGHVVYEGVGAQRVFYLIVLISHIVLAGVVPILAILLLVFAWRRQLGRHRALARWTLPMWLYVSVTGVIVYLMLYVL